METLTRRQRVIVLALTIAIGLTRFVPLSLGPWDWDEVLFCLAVDHYNVALHQPHPAGFPLFILLGKIARLFTSSDFHALQAVNVLVSILVFPVMVWVARAFRLDFIASLAAGLLFAFLPNVWFFGGTAFSDPLGMLLFLAAIAAYLSAGTNARRYFLASALLGAAVLVRPQNAVVAVFPWFLATFRLFRAKQIRTIIAGSLLLIVLVGIGYGAAAYVTGFEPYTASVLGHSKYVSRADSVGSVGRPPLLDVVAMLLNPFDSAKLALALNALALVAIVFGRRRVSAEVVLTFLPFILFAMVAANPAGASRFSLNYLAGFVVLAVEGVDVIARRLPRMRLAIHAVVVAALLARMITWSLPAFEQPRNTVAPPTAAALWLDRNVPKTSTLFVDASMWPWVKYFAPDHRQVMVNSTTQVLSHPQGLNGWFVALSPPPTQSNATSFLRPRNRTWNIVTKRGFEAYVQPTQELIGFGDGWYNLEEDGISQWRWSARRAFIHLGPSNEPREIYLYFHTPQRRDGKPVYVTFTLNGEPAGTILGKEETEVRFEVRNRGGRGSLLRIELSDVLIPKRDSGTHDERQLGIMLRAWSWRPAR